MEDKVAVLITTSHRGVYFGYIDESDIDTRPTLRVSNMRHVYYWAKGLAGIYELPTKGPPNGSRLTATPVPEISIDAVANVAPCTPEAIERFENGTWSD